VTYIQWQIKLQSDRLVQDTYINLHADPIWATNYSTLKRQCLQYAIEYGIGFSYISNKHRFHYVSIYIHLSRAVAAILDGHTADSSSATLHTPSKTGHVCLPHWRCQLRQKCHFCHYYYYYYYYYNYYCHYYTFSSLIAFK